MMAPTDDLFFRCSYPSLEPPCFRRIDHLSQVWSRTYCDDLWVAPLGRLQAHLACRMSGLGSTPVPSSIAEPRTAFRCKPRLHRTSHSRLALAGRLSSHRVKLNDPSNRAFLRNPVSPLASRPSKERELAPLVHIVQAALSLSAAQPKATPVAIRPLGESLNPTKGTSFASDTVRDQFLVAPRL
jgi:hypothetical protein